jgi:hypothetical protein
MRGAATRRVHGRALPKRYCARFSNCEATHELGQTRALELALEKPLKLCVFRCLLAVRNAKRIGLAFYKTKKRRVSPRASFATSWEDMTYGVARLLRKDLSE